MSVLFSAQFGAGPTLNIIPANLSQPLPWLIAESPPGQATTTPGPPELPNLSLSQVQGGGSDKLGPGPAPDPRIDRQDLASPSDAAAYSGGPGDC